MFSLIGRFGRIVLHAKWEQRDAQRRIGIERDVEQDRWMRGRFLVEDACARSTDGSIIASGELLKAFLCHEEYISRPSLPPYPFAANLPSDEFIGMFRHWWIRKEKE